RASGHEGPELALHLGDPATERGVAHLDAMLARRRTGEPLQHVVGRWGFRTLDLLVDARALIPRPETEVVAGLALGAIAGKVRPTAVDLGTGTGAIALALAAEHPSVEVWATDRSVDALDVARANLAGLGRPAARVRMAEGHWYGALPAELQGEVELVVSNPPYVAADDEMPDEVRLWEPEVALVPGPTGLEDLEVVVGESTVWLRPGGTLVVEHGDAQGEAVRRLAEAAGLVEVRTEQDLAGRDRALVAVRPS
ncbi:protein-(glutamine-N5) methyltransferase, release factor-specific, partial [cyanobacterium TDX16]